MTPMAYRGPSWTTSVDPRNRSKEELSFLGQHVGSCQVKAWHSLRDAAESAQAFFAGHIVTSLTLVILFVGLVAFFL